MKQIQVFDPAMNSSMGVSGGDVDPKLATFSADVDWAQKKGALIERFNLAQQPTAFAENAVVKDLLKLSGEQALPVILVDGELALAGSYPIRSDLARWAGISKPVVEIKAESHCCSGGNCG